MRFGRNVDHSPTSICYDDLPTSLLLTLSRRSIPMTASLTPISSHVTSSVSDVVGSDKGKDRKCNRLPPRVVLMAFAAASILLLRDLLKKLIFSASSISLKPREFNESRI